MDWTGQFGQKLTTIVFAGSGEILESLARRGGIATSSVDDGARKRSFRLAFTTAPDECERGQKLECN